MGRTPVNQKEKQLFQPASCIYRKGPQQNKCYYLEWSVQSRVPVKSGCRTQGWRSVGTSAYEWQRQLALGHQRQEHNPSLVPLLVLLTHLSALLPASDLRVAGPKATPLLTWTWPFCCIPYSCVSSRLPSPSVCPPGLDQGPLSCSLGLTCPLPTWCLHLDASQASSAWHGHRADCHHLPTKTLPPSFIFCSSASLVRSSSESV